MESANRRKETRVEHSFFIRFRNVSPLALHGWEMSITKNISKSGILFNVFQYHKRGSELELKLKLPQLSGERTFWANVVRCKSSEMEGVYEIAARLSNKEEETRKAFDYSINSLIEKKRGTKSNANSHPETLKNRVTLLSLNIL